MIEEVRVYSQQLSEAVFDKPGELVHWMGAVQAQHYQMAKWAVGLRLKSATLQTVEEALRRGEILRTHVMRPTWHFVAAEDIGWMLKLSFRGSSPPDESFAKSKNLGITEKSYFRCNRLFERMLEGNEECLTKENDDGTDEGGIGSRFCSVDPLSNACGGGEESYAVVSIDWRKSQLMLCWKNGCRL